MRRPLPYSVVGGLDASLSGSGLGMVASYYYRLMVTRYSIVGRSLARVCWEEFGGSRRSSDSRISSCTTQLNPPPPEQLSGLNVNQVVTALHTHTQVEDVLTAIYNTPALRSSILGAESKMF